MAVITAGLFFAVAEEQEPIFLPEFQPSGDSLHPVAHSVVISSSTPTAVIRYTFDGSTPTVNTHAHSSPVTVRIDRSRTLRASAWVGTAASDVTSATYTISGWVSAGNKHSAVLKADGSAWTWGQNGSGHLGDGTLNDREHPGPVPGLTDVIALSAGENHTLVIRRSAAAGDPQDRGTVWGWGHNGSGRLGNGTTTTGKSPVQVLKGPNDPLPDVVEVSAGATHSLALDSSGRVWAWGDNANGRLGLGSFGGSFALYAMQVPDLENVIAIAAGGSHSLALKEDPVTQVRTLYAWGSNANGRLGMGGTSPSSSSSPVAVVLPTKPGSSDKVILEGIEAGDAHTVAVDSDGLIYAWGHNPGGRLGVSSSATSITAPARVTELPGSASFVMAVAGETFSMALDSEGGVWVWGDNESGQFANDSTIDSGAVNVALPRPANVIAAGNRHALAILDDGQVAVWGNNQFGQLGIDITLYSPVPELIASFPEGAGTLSAGTSHSLALPAGGPIHAWGDNTYGQLGIGSVVSKLVPVAVSLPGALAISAGDRHSLAISVDGSGIRQLYAWGNGTNGKLGLGSSLANRPSPTLVSLPNAVAVSAGDAHSLAITEHPATGVRNLHAWGSNGNSRLGDGTTTQQVTPKLISTDIGGSPLPPLTAVAASESHSLALTSPESGGKVLAWGSHSGGRLGNGSTSGTTSRPAPIASLGGMTAIAAGLSHSLALGGNGSTWAWGNNGSGRLGDGTSTTRPVPVQVLTAPGVPLAGIVAIAAGGAHSLALDESQRVWAWGDNTWGQLGDGTLVISKYAKPVPDLSGVIAIAAGDQHSLALTSSGEIFAWGYDMSGQLGNEVAGYMPYVETLQDFHVAILEDSDGDGVADWIETQNGTSPLDYYNAQPPSLLAVAGNNQTGPAESFLAEALRVRVTRQGAPLVNAPVRFSVLPGGGLLAASPSSSELNTAIDLRTDSDGYAFLFYRMSGAQSSQQIDVTAGSASTAFSATLFEPPPPTPTPGPTPTPPPGPTPTPSPGPTPTPDPSPTPTPTPDPDADTDGDGVSDGEDEFPNDPRRSRRLPAQKYAVIELDVDLSSSDSVTLLAIDNEGKVGIYHGPALFDREYPDYAYASEQGAVSVWEDGDFTTKEKPLIPPYGPERNDDPAPWYPEEASYETRIYNLSAIDASGRIYGTAESSPGCVTTAVYSNYKVPFKWQKEWAEETDMVLTGNYWLGTANANQHVDWWVDDVPAANNNEQWVGQAVWYEEEPSPGANWQRPRGFKNDHVPVTPERAMPYAISESGRIAGWVSNESDSENGKLWVENQTIDFALSTGPDLSSIGINDQSEVVGIRDGKAFFKRGDEQVARLLEEPELLPERVTKDQVTFARPFSINNNSQVIFEGQCLDQEDHSENAQMVNCDLLWQRAADGTVSVNIMEFPPQWELDFRDMNDSGVIVAVGKRTDNGQEIKRPVILLPVEFLTKGTHGEMVLQGFTYNSVAPPEILAYSICSVDQHGLISVSISGTVRDDTSDLIDDPAKQLQFITISAPGIADQTLPLENHAQSEPPWRPYAFASQFSTNISFQGSGAGLYTVGITTSENAGGVSASTQQAIIVTENRLNVVFNGNLDPMNVDTIRVFAGGTSTAGPEEVLAETGAASKNFIFGPSDDSLQIEVLSSAPFTIDVDNLNVRMWRKISEGVYAHKDYQMTETGGTSLHFAWTGLEAECGHFPETARGTFFPTLVRFPALELLSGQEIKVEIFEQEWSLESKNLGDGDFLYVVDAQHHPVIFNPSAQAQTHIQTRRLLGKFEVTIKNGRQTLGTSSIEVVQGLIVKGEGVEDMLGNVTGIDKEKILSDGPNRATYRWYHPKSNAAGLGYKNEALDTEILWRYVGTPDTVAIFDSRQQLLHDLDVRKAIVETARSAPFAFGLTFSGNSTFWDGMMVRRGQNAFDAIKDAFHPERSYSMECKAAARLILLHAVSTVMGRQAFNQKVANSPFGEFDKIFSEVVVGAPVLKSNWRPGDLGYLRNTTATPEAIAGGQIGENIIYLGGKFSQNESDFETWAHFWGLYGGNRIRTLKEWTDEVNRWPAGNGAQLLPGRIFWRGR